MIMYVDGDSYTTPNVCVNPTQSYWHLFGNYLGLQKVVNNAYPRKSNEGMIRCATRFCIENSNKDLVVLIGFSHLERFDLFDQDQHPVRVSKNPNHAEHGVVSLAFTEDPLRVKFYNREFEESRFLSMLINFYSFLKSRKNVKFMLHSCTDPLVLSNMPLIQTFQSEVAAYPEIINLFDNTYSSINQNLGVKPVDFDQYQWRGHHGAEGNEIYSQFLIKKYQEIYEN